MTVLDRTFSYSRTSLLKTLFYQGLVDWDRIADRRTTPQVRSHRRTTLRVVICLAGIGAGHFRSLAENSVVEFAEKFGRLHVRFRNSWRVPLQISWRVSLQ